MRMSFNPITNGALDLAGAAALTALIVQQTKWVIEHWVTTTNDNHDNVIRLYVDAIALIIVIGAELAAGILRPNVAGDWLNAVVQGVGVALTAIGGYHIVNGLIPQTPDKVDQQAQALATALAKALLGPPKGSVQVQVVSGPANDGNNNAGGGQNGNAPTPTPTGDQQQTIEIQQGGAPKQPAPVPSSRNGGGTVFQ
jgi:hypothetical protein